MIRVVFDTNIIISGYIGKEGRAPDICTNKLGKNNFIHLTSSDTLNELDRVT